MINVFLVDDHELVRTGIRRIIEDVRGMNVAGEAESGEDAVKWCRSNHADVILMDMNMPVMNGIESAKKIKAIRDVPIIGLTATTEEEMIKTFYEAGISDHITKPFSKMDLLRGIAKNIKSFQAIFNFIAPK